MTIDQRNYMVLNEGHILNIHKSEDNVTYAACCEDIKYQRKGLGNKVEGAEVSQAFGNDMEKIWCPHHGKMDPFKEDCCRNNTWKKIKFSTCKHQVAGGPNIELVDQHLDSSGEKKVRLEKQTTQRQKNLMQWKMTK